MTDFNITANLNHPQVESAVQYLASLDGDHATTQNGIGFNGRDTDFGCSIAASSKIKRLSDKQLEGIIKTLWRYNNTQLQPAGYIIPTLGELQLWLKERERLHPYVPARVVLPATTPNTPVSMGAVVLVDGELSVTMPTKYWLWTPAMHSMTVQDRMVPKYNRTSKLWTLPLDWLDRLLLVCPQTDFVYDPVLLQTQADTQKRQEAAAEEREIAAARRELQVRKLMKVAQLDAPLSNGWLLHDYQKAGVEFIFQYSNVLLADDLGLGKTLQSLKAAKAYQDLYDADILCIVPLSTISNWYREAAIVGCNITVVSPSVFKIPLPSTVTRKFVLIADEAHVFKNTHSKRTKAWLALCASPHIVANIAMSATPIKNGSPADIFPLLKGLKHSLGVNRAKFDVRYGSSALGYLRELYQLLTVEEPVMLRRLKKDVLQLPPFTRQTVEGELSATAQQVYNTAFRTLQEDYNNRVASGEISSGGEALVILNHLRHAGSRAKIETGVSLALEFLQGVDGLEGQQVVLFTTFKDSAHLLQTAIEEKGFSVGLLTGDIPERQRQPMFDRFQSKQLDVIVATAQAGGVGINLFSASKVILVDRDYNLNTQLEGRLHRQGQENPVDAFWISHTLIDRWLDSKLVEKAETSDLILEGYSTGLDGVNWDSEARDLLAAIFNGEYKLPTIDVDYEVEEDTLPAYDEEF